MDLRARLRAIVDPLPPGAAVTLPADTLRVWLDEATGGGVADLTVEEVGQQYDRAPSTVRTWCGDGRLPGAYRLNGREWRIPRAALAELREGGKSPTGDGDPVDLGSWRKEMNKGAGR